MYKSPSRIFYDFGIVNGALVKDRSKIGPPLDLRIENLQNVQRSSGSLKVIDNTIIRSIRPAEKISKAIKNSGEFTLEAWVRPEKLKQSGPARIVTVSGNSTNRNITLGQSDNQYDIRLRTSETNNNGLPSISSTEARLMLSPTHLIFTRQEKGNVNLYINGL